MTPVIDRHIVARSEGRLSMLTEMMATLSQTRDPDAALTIFYDTMRKMWNVNGYVALSSRGLGPGQYRLLRHQDHAGRDLIDGVGFGEDESALPIHSGGWLSEVCADTTPKLFRHLDRPHDEVVGSALATFRSAIAAPIFEQGEVVRWAILFDCKADTFTEESLEQFVLRANLIGSVIQNLHNVALLERARSQIDREVERIAQIQRSLLPTVLPEITGLRIAANYETFDRAGGDIYAFHNLDFVTGGCAGSVNPDTPWAIFIGDVSGHGPAAAVVMAMVHAILEAYPRRPDLPSDVLAHANRHLASKQIDASFVTAFLAFYDPKTRRLTYSAAGHPPRRADYFAAPWSCCTCCA